MSFTAQVKDELSRIEGSEAARYAQLSAIMRVCGTLSLHGSGRYALSVSTETGAVARTMIKLTHELFDLETPLTVRHSVLHNTRNYLIEIPEQPELEEDLHILQILVPGQGLATGLPHGLLVDDGCRRAFMRGAFMAGGFVADPRRDFHLEIAVAGEGFATELADLIGSYGIRARINRRRGAFAIYSKSFEDVRLTLQTMGAERSARAVESIRQMKSLKNDVNRQVNADMANSLRAAQAAGDQRALVERARATVGFHALPPALREFCELRLAHPELSLAELGAFCRPPASKSAMYHRLLRLQKIVSTAEGGA